MILEFTVKNFASIKEETTFSLIAETSKSKSQNIFEATIAKDEKIRVLTSVVIYGPNASGKTTMLKAFGTFLSLIKDTQTEAGEEISDYNPFLFDEATRSQPTFFSLAFIGPEKIKYIYSFSYNQTEIIAESLEYFPKGSKATLLSRDKGSDKMNELIHIGLIQNKKEMKVFKNRLLLSTFGKDEPHELLSNVFIYFNKFKFQNLGLQFNSLNNNQRISELFVKDEWVKDSLNELIKIGDLKINEVYVKERMISENQIPRNFTLIYERSGIHDVFKNGEKITTEALPFYMESKGTSVLFNIGGTILDVLRKGDILLIDELETSLHPNLCKLLIDVFHSTDYNPNGAQLIFTTHNISLLNNTIFRKDQIWLCQKDNYGATDVYSIQDFKDVREDTPFERWYLAGKFGALPKITFPDISIKENNKV